MSVASAVQQCEFQQSATAATEVPTTALEATQSWHIDHATHHVQGLAATDDWFWLTSVDRQAHAGCVYRVDRKTLRVEQQRQLALGEQFHPGGIQLAGNDLWVPLAEYRAHSTSTILRLDPNTLETRGSFGIDDHIGAIAADGRGTLYAGNWDCKQIITLSREGKILARTDNPTAVAYQDIEWHDGLLWAVGRVREPAPSRAFTSVVDTIDPKTWKLVRRYTLSGRTRSGGSDFGREGFTKLGDSLLLMPEDGPNTTIYRFKIPR